MLWCFGWCAFLLLCVHSLPQPLERLLRRLLPRLLISVYFSLSLHPSSSPFFFFVFFISLLKVDYVCAALALVARDGWRLLPLYQFNHASGEWFHQKTLNKFPARKWLSSSFKSLRLQSSSAAAGAAAAADAPALEAGTSQAEAGASEAEVLAAQVS